MSLHSLRDDAKCQLQIFGKKIQRDMFVVEETVKGEMFWTQAP